MPHRQGPVGVRRDLAYHVVEEGVRITSDGEDVSGTVFLKQKDAAMKKYPGFNDDDEPAGTNEEEDGEDGDGAKKKSEKLNVKMDYVAWTWARW